MHFPITRIETHSIPDGTETTRDAEGNTVTKQRFANVQVEMRYTSGVVRVKANRNKDMAAGFNASINYNDGVGHARAPHTGQMHEVHGSCSVGACPVQLWCRRRGLSSCVALLHGGMSPECCTDVVLAGWVPDVLPLGV